MPPAPTTTWRLISSSPPRGALAILQLIGSQGGISAAFRELGLADVPTGRIALRHISGADTLLISRDTDGCAFLFPHAGPAAIRAVVRALEQAGVRPELASAPATAERAYPEAASALEARMLDTLSRAPSPLAIDLLLEQPRRWFSGAHEMPPEQSATLRCLIDPPTIAAIGPPNVGKSSLLNALAGRPVAVVADEPGTTRDHVGASIDLGGLVVRWIDCPGFDLPTTAAASADPIQAESQRLARSVVQNADLLIHCGDATSGFLPGTQSTYPVTAPTPEQAPGSTTPTLRIALRADLGVPPRSIHDLAVSTKSGHGLDSLITTLRDTLVPPATLADPRPWRFWLPETA